MSGNDLLGQRVVLALREILVISDSGELYEHPRALASYYDMLQRNAFGNFRNLLYDVTIHPCMGFYLSHSGNRKPDTTANRFPDENYAREIMHLFTIGLYELNMDDSRKLDSDGNPELEPYQELLSSTVRNIIDQNYQNIFEQSYASAVNIGSRARWPTSVRSKMLRILPPNFRQTGSAQPCAP